MFDKPLPELVNPAKTALLIVDVQNDFCHPEGSAARGGCDISAPLAMIPRLQALIAAARAAGARVIFIQTIHEDATNSDAWLGRLKSDRKNCLKDTWGAQFTDLDPLPDEPVVVKHRYSAFVNTRLDSILRTWKIETIVTTGVATNVCVESTARHGYMLDYHLVLASDCSAAYDAELHDATLRNIGKHFGRVASAEEIIAAWSVTPALQPA
jgi:ureidoacrylate peracid hydrolase